MKQDNRAYQREYRARNRERLSASRKAEYQVNREQLLRDKGEYYVQNRDNILAQKRQQYVKDRPAILARHKECRLRNPGPHREALWRRAGISISYSEYLDLVDKQDGRCAICGEYKGTELRVDHCHKTGRIRGLLCDACNVGIGKLGDVEHALLRAYNYLREAQ